jgi:hypothetical protein
MEFQRRGAPHLHLWVVIDPENPKHTDLLKVVRHWLKLTKNTGTKERGQHIAPIDPRIAWARYLAKHMARGRAHYQREKLPDGWQVSGRVWGKSGDWPTISERVDLDNAAAFKLRRLFRRYVGKRHAAAGAGVNGKNHSSVRGANVWLSQNATRRAALWATGGDLVTPDGEVIAETSQSIGVWLGGCLVPRSVYMGAK